MDARTVLEGCTVTVAPDRYAVVTADGPVAGALATVDDGRETTHVIQEDRLDDVPTTACEPGWALLTFEAVLPFDLVGFLAAVATALAEREVPVFALSAYSTDHVLVPDADLERALAALAELGCVIDRA